MLATEVAAHRHSAFSDVADKRAALVRALHQQGVTGVTDHY
jgi:hypothetical protein